MADDDDDEPAITEGMEAEYKQGDQEPALGGGDDGDDPVAAEEFNVGDSVESLQVIGRRTHVKSAETKRLLKLAAESLKAQKDAGEFDEDDLEYDEDEKPAPGDRPAQPAAKIATPTPTQQQQAPVAALDPKLQEREAELSARHTELTQREQALAERERSADLQTFHDAWIEGRPIDAIRAILKSRGIAESDEAWKDEAAEIITDLSEKVFGTKVDPTLRNTIDSRRTKRMVLAGRRQVETERQALDRQRLEAEHKQQWEAARASVARELSTDARKEALPFLTSLDNAGQVVMEWCQKETDAGRTISWEDAATAANDYIKDQAVKHSERWRPLIEKVSKPKQNGTQRPPGRPPGTSQVIKAPPTEQQQAVQPKPTAVQATNGRNWNETHRKNTKRMMRAAFKTEE